MIAVLVVSAAAMAVPILGLLPRRPVAFRVRRHAPRPLLPVLAGALVGFGTGSWLLAVAVVAPGLARPRLANLAEARRRAQRLDRAWPEALEVLSMGVSVGMPIDELLAFGLRCGPQPTRELFEFGRAELISGATRRQVLRSLADRGGDVVRPVVDVLLAADRDGASVALVLDRLAAESSRVHRLAAEERSRRAPVLMLAPLTLCCLPAVLIGTIAPFVLLTFGQASL